MQTNTADTFPADDDMRDDEAGRPSSHFEQEGDGRKPVAYFEGFREVSDSDDEEYGAFIRGRHDEYTALRAAQHRRRRAREALSTLLGRDLSGAEITITIKL